MIRIPNIPPSLKVGSVGECQARERERVTLMQQHFPEERVSPHPTNPLSLQEGSKERPWLGLPLVIYREVELSEQHAAEIEGADNLLKDPATGYVSYNDLKFVSGLPDGAIFAYVTHRLKRQIARPSVNRPGDHVYIKFLAP